MPSNALKTIVLPLAIIAAGFALIVGLSPSLDEHRGKMPVEYEDNDLSMNGSKLKGFALGFEGLMADWYWMRSLQYIGGKIVRAGSDSIDIDDLSDLNPRLLYPYLENATDLDPHFLAAYDYGAVVLPAIDPAKAIAIAEKGIANNPGEWRLYQQLGYIYWKLKQYNKAADSFEKGSQIPDAAPFMKLMAASMRTEGGSRATAREIYRQMLASDDPRIKITAERRLNELDSLDEREAIDRVLAEYKEKTGRCANNFGEIAPRLAQVKLPLNRQFRIDTQNRLVDPTDAPYVLDKEICRVRLDPSQTGLPVK